MEIIHNGVDLNIFSPNLFNNNRYRQKYFKKDEIIIGLIARYHPDKGHNIFLKSAGLINNKLNNIKFLLNGTDVEENNIELMEMIKSQDIENIVHISNPHLDITEILPVCDILVSSSYFESFPNIICEAMACAIPCVVTNVGDCSKIVGNTGISVKPNDSFALASVIIELIKMSHRDRKKMGEKARLRIENNFTLISMVEKYSKIYSLLLTI
jgi:glycosyltransferase involved in cell wall biosynthesis